MTAFFQAHLGDEEGVCPDHRNLQTAHHHISFLSGTPSPQLMRGSGNSMLEFVLCISLSVCGFFHLCLCLAFFFICLFVWMVSFGGWWLPAIPLCEVAARKPGVCSILFRPLWLAARPEVAAGASASLAQKVRSSGHWRGQQHGST